MTPKVSVIVPTHNRLNYLEQALISIVQQSLSDLEIIVVDDCSYPPITESFVKQIADNIRLVRHEKSKGGPVAKNTGARMAKGKYIAFLDDDDLYAPDYLMSALNALESYQGIDVFFMGVKWFSGDLIWGEYNQNDALEKIIEYAAVERNQPIYKFEGEALFEALLNGVPMAFQRPVTTLEHFNEIGFYKEDCLLWDCEWALRAALSSKCGLINRGLYWQRASQQGYFSRPNTQINQSISVLEIKKSFLPLNLKPELIKTLKESIIQAEKDLIWGYILSENYGSAFKTLFKTLKHGVFLFQLKFCLSILHRIFKSIYGSFNLLIARK